MSGYSWSLPTPSSTPVGSDTDPMLDVVGRDLLFTDDTQLTPSGDYQTIEGKDLVRQAVLTRLMVKPGEYRVRPEYGVGVESYVKKAMGQSTLDQLKSRITEQLHQEPLVESVLDVTLSKVDGAFPGLKVGVRVRAAGREMRFDPFVFVEAA